jgi:hypothetical protein
MPVVRRCWCTTLVYTTKPVCALHQRLPTVYPRPLLVSAGSLEDVVRTRVFVKRVADWEAVCRAHGRVFRDIAPANTLVQASLVGDEYLVEIEAEAEMLPQKE